MLLFSQPFYFSSFTFNLYNCFLTCIHSTSFKKKVNDKYISSSVVYIILNIIFYYDLLSILYNCPVSQGISLRNSVDINRLITPLFILWLIIFTTVIYPWVHLYSIFSVVYIIFISLIHILALLTGIWKYKYAEFYISEHLLFSTC